MDQSEILMSLRAAQREMDREDQPVHRLYSFLKVAEDGVAVLLNEAELITYINARMTLMEQFQIRPGQQRPIA